MVGTAARTMAAEGTLRAIPLLELRRDARAAIFIAYISTANHPRTLKWDYPGPADIALTFLGFMRPLMRSRIRGQRRLNARVARLVPRITATPDDPLP